MYLLAALVRHDRIVSGPRICAQDHSVLRRRCRCLSTHPISPTAAALLAHQSHPLAHLEHKSRDGGPGLACMRDPKGRENAFQGCISANRGVGPGFGYASRASVSSPNSSWAPSSLGVSLEPKLPNTDIPSAKKKGHSKAQATPD